jgi:Fe-S-cluster-containing hydrogenase component 2
MAYVVALPCVDVKDRACAEECPVDAIYEGERMVYINAEECVDCGSCAAVCPVEAIFYEDDLPEEYREFYDIGVKLFAQTGASGGAYRVGPLGVDEPRVAALPPQH